MTEPTVLLSPTIQTDGGPWARHNMSCPVCSVRVAVLDLDDGTFHPCWSCQEKGWELRRTK